MIKHATKSKRILLKEYKLLISELTYKEFKYVFLYPRKFLGFHKDIKKFPDPFLYIIKYELN